MSIIIKDANSNERRIIFHRATRLVILTGKTIGRKIRINHAYRWSSGRFRFFGVSNTRRNSDTLLRRFVGRARTLSSSLCVRAPLYGSQQYLRRRTGRVVWSGVRVYRSPPPPLSKCRLVVVLRSPTMTGARTQAVKGTGNWRAPVTATTTTTTDRPSGVCIIHSTRDRRTHH